MGQTTLNIPVPLGNGGADADSAGNIYVSATNSGSDVLNKYSPNGIFLHQMPVRRNTSNLTIDETNSLLYLGNATGGIDIFDIHPTPPLLINSISNIRIVHLHFDRSHDSLFAVTSGPGPGIELDTLGGVRQIYSLPASYGAIATVNDVIAVLVPEPWSPLHGMLLAGFLGFSCRSRENTVSGKKVRRG